MAAFVRLASEVRLDETPMVLETPLGEDGLGHKRDLDTLRGKLRGS